LAAVVAAIVASVLTAVVAAGCLFSLVFFVFSAAFSFLELHHQQFCLTGCI
jgi:hypothetical protein